MDKQLSARQRATRSMARRLLQSGLELFLDKVERRWGPPSSTCEEFSVMRPERMIAIDTISNQSLQGCKMADDFAIGSPDISVAGAAGFEKAQRAGNPVGNSL